MLTFRVESQLKLLWIILIIRLNHSIGPHFRREISSKSPFFHLSQLGPYFGKFVAIRSFPLVIQLACGT